MNININSEGRMDLASPDSGVGDGERIGMGEQELVKRSQEEEQMKKALLEELEKINGEVQTLRQVLKNKVERATEIRNSLSAMGVGESSMAGLLWVKGGALGESIGGGIDNFKKSAPVVKAGEVINDIQSAAAPLFSVVSESYQKTVEKTSSLFAKVKENTAYKSIEERLGGVYQTARSKIPGVGGGGDFEEAFKEGEKAAAATATLEGQEGGAAAVAAQPEPQQQPQQMA